MTEDVDLWQGAFFLNDSNRVLILGESWYGVPIPLKICIPEWIEKLRPDNTFSRIFNACSGTQSDKATTAERKAFWDKVSFYNFVPGSVGKERQDRPSAEHYSLGASLLRSVLNELQPRKVWILGKEQSKYSAPIVREFGIEPVVVAHPSSWGLSNAILKNSWSAVTESENLILELTPSQSKTITPMDRAHYRGPCKCKR